MSVNKFEPFLFQPHGPATAETINADVVQLGDYAHRNTLQCQTNGIEILHEEQITFSGVKRLVQTATFKDKDGIVQELRILPKIDRKHSTSPIVMLPGCTEDITRGTAKNLANQIALLNPGSDIASVASDGLSKHGTQFTPEQIFRRGFPAIGAARARVAGVFADGRPVNFVAESMGAVELTHAIHTNLAEKVADIHSVVLHSDGMVTPSGTAARMVGAFLPMLVLDATVTATLHPIQALHNMEPRTDLLHPKAWAAIGSQVVHLLAGMDKDLMSEAAEVTFQGFVKGQFDPLYQSSLLNWLKNKHPKTVDVHITKSGHAAALNYIGASAKIQDAFGRLAHLRSKHSRR